jgi:AbrB family looped-hinge helix DNA binding protein
MGAITISPKYQIVIPKEVREMLHLRPGQKIKMLVIDGAATIIPVLSLEQLEGIAEGIDIEGYREEEDEERW